MLSFRRETFSLVISFCFCFVFLGWRGGRVVQKNYRSRKRTLVLNFQKMKKSFWVRIIFFKLSFISLMNLSFMTINLNFFLQEDKVMNVVFIETNNLNVFWPRNFRPKMYFLFKRSWLMVVNAGSFSKRTVFKKRITKFWWQLCKTLG